jgi:Rrf2 family transcriptional regulator, nitric oxide-sensitive transcriptional repressor
MNKMNRKVEYALMALKYMSQKEADQLTSVKEICQSTGVPFDATSRVMQLMAQKKFLKVEMGAQGGYAILKDLTDVSFLEIIETVLSPVEVVRCASGEEKCEFFGNCNIQTPLQVFNNKLTDFYRTLSIAELIQVNMMKGEKSWPTQTQV